MLSLLSLLLAILPAHCSYYYTQGQDWNGTCQNGINQSPVDISTGSFPDTPYTEKILLSKDNIVQGRYQLNPHLDFYAEYTVLAARTVEFTNANVVVDLGNGGGSLVFMSENEDVKIYEALQMHFHSPAEHTFDGESRHYDLELHIVHRRYNVLDSEVTRLQNATGNTTEVDESHNKLLAVLAIFFDVEKGGNVTNEFIEDLNLKNLSGNVTHMKTQTLPELKVHLNKIISNFNKEKLYHYDGSLTTPPCSQTVAWLVVDDPQPITREQLKVFQEYWQNNQNFSGGNGNNRKTQPVGDRVIYKHANHDKWEHTVYLQGYSLRASGCLIMTLILSLLF
ncbi:hypothetical protein FGO68_gene6943 [Halteria grandinella]|uniref:carbonic anhydrase n=1 Tax=Halteria grandinella TaxID=5974 RepID=A0A8J8T014_HALGN|nr:hypothetical protein FGO68_gene6943 [Halteria grandinella]